MTPYGHSRGVKIVEHSSVKLDKRVAKARGGLNRLTLLVDLTHFASIRKNSSTRIKHYYVLHRNIK